MGAAVPIMAAGLMINAYDRIDVLMLKLFTDSESVGYYGIAYRLIDLAAPLSFMFVNSVYPSSRATTRGASGPSSTACTSVPTTSSRWPA